MSTVMSGEITTSTQPRPGSLQSSALSITGPNFTTKEKPRNFISYVHKSLPDSKYKHFGTRVRIIGKIESSKDSGQTANGSSNLYVVNGSTPDKNINVSGGTAGISVLLNTSTNPNFSTNSNASSNSSCCCCCSSNWIRHYLLFFVTTV